MAEEKIVVSLREIAERFGIGIEGARAKAKRRSSKGHWRILPQNHPADPLRVEIPSAEFSLATEDARQQAPNKANASPPTPTSQQEDQRQEPHDIKALVSLLQQFAEQASASAERITAAEVGRAEAEGRAAIAALGRTAAEAEMRRARAELEELRASLSAEAVSARAELAEWRGRSWWRRLAG